MSVNTFLIALLAVLTIVVTFADGEPVCYSREQIDDLNVKVTRVPCDANNHSLYKAFATPEDVTVTDLLDAHCRYEDLPKVLNGYFKIRDCTGRRIKDTCKVTCNDGYTVTSSMGQTTCQDSGNGHAAWSLYDLTCHKFTCSFDELPKVSRGYINMSDCSGNTGNDVCNVTCEENYYPADRKQTVCKYAGNQKGEWLSVNLSCSAMSCPFNKLPTVVNGQFNSSNCTGNLVHDTCDMACNVNYYTTTTQKTLCQNIGSNEGRWTTDNFTCDAITCPFNNLPSVTHGQFHLSDCSGNYVGDTCDMTCETNYCTSVSKQTTCQNVGSHQGSWTIGTFICKVRGSCERTQWRGHNYISCTAAMDWNAADSHCRSMYAHLVYINNTDENSFVQNMLINCNLNYASIGLRPLNSMQLDRGWKWQDNSIASYTYWASGQLDDFEGCVGIASDGLWHDYPCNSPYYYICEY